MTVYVPELKEPEFIVIVEGFPEHTVVADGTLKELASGLAFTVTTSEIMQPVVDEV